LSRARLITIALRVQIERRLNLAVTQKRLHRFRIGLRLIHQPIAKSVPKVMESKVPRIVVMTLGVVGFYRQLEIVGGQLAGGGLDCNTARSRSCWDLT